MTAVEPSTNVVKRSSPKLETEEASKEEQKTQGMIGKTVNYLSDSIKNSRARLVGLVFVGMYAVVHGWFLIQILVTFWDIYLPLNINISDYLFFNHGFLVFLLQLIILVWSLWRVLLRPESSLESSNRWHIGIVSNLMVFVFYYSNMAGEPLDEIGGSWFGEDLRLPSFFSKSGFTFRHYVFSADMAYCFRPHENFLNSGINFVFRPYLSAPAIRADGILSKYRENWRGILAYAYLYASYWFLIFVVASTWTELIVLFAAIYISRFSIGTANDFINGRSRFLLLFAPICACFRAYYAYDEWCALGSRWIFALKIAYCLSQIVIFAGWYSSSSSVLAKWTHPYILDECGEEANGEVVEEGERVILGAAPESKDD